MRSWAFSGGRLSAVDAVQCGLGVFYCFGGFRVRHVS